jgi:hypothetical protein
MTRSIVVSLPFEGRWSVENSPARRVPSHGTDLMGERYAIDFVAVDEHRRTAYRRHWRTLLSTEPAERFLAFGRPILAPADGVVAHVHDGEVDHDGRRSQLTLLPYAFSQSARLRQGVAAIAGNYVIVALSRTGTFVLLAHLKAGSLRVTEGEHVAAGQPIAECGNSGNSTQPHLHLQAMNNADPSIAAGVAIAFHRFREYPRGADGFQIRGVGVPAEGAVVEPLHVALRA